MAYVRYDKSWRSEFYNIVLARNRVQDLTLSHLKHKVNDTYGKDEKTTTKFQPSSDEDVVQKPYLDTKLSNLEGHISFIE